MKSFGIFIMVLGVIMFAGALVLTFGNVEQSYENAQARSLLFPLSYVSLILGAILLIGNNLEEKLTWLIKVVYDKESYDNIPSSFACPSCKHKVNISIIEKLSNSFLCKNCTTYFPIPKISDEGKGS